MGVTVDTSYAATNPAIVTAVSMNTYNTITVDLIDQVGTLFEDFPVATVNTMVVSLTFPFPTPGVTISEVCYVDI